MTTLTQQYKDAMSQMVQSVSILTYQHDDLRIGVTVTSASSYAAEPPIFMAAINKESTLAQHVALGDGLCMNLLRHEEQSLAERFSGATDIHGAERFLEGEWDFHAQKAPRLNTALCTFRGELRALIPQASHAILLVEIDEITQNAGSPLTYFQRSYRQD